MNRVIPGILEKEWAEIEAKIELVKNFSNTIHIDFIDGIFSSNKTFFEFEPFSKYSKDLSLEAHLMTDEPLQYIEKLASAGFRRFLGHIEKMSNVDEFVARGQLLGEVGIALDNITPIDDLKLNLEDLDCILLVGIRAGHSGQEFLPQTLDKIKALRSRTLIPIEVDGGIDEATIIQTKSAGANRFVTTSFIFESPSPQKAYEKLSDLSSDLDS